LKNKAALIKVHFDLLNSAHNFNGQGSWKWESKSATGNFA